MTLRTAALDQLERVANDYAAAERAFRENYAREIARLETERRRAFRRLNFMTALVVADAHAADRDASRAAQQAAAAEELGWSEEEAAGAEIQAAFEPLADAIRNARLRVAEERREADADDGAPQEICSRAEREELGPPDVLSALTAFEVRFERLQGRPFAAQFDRDFPDTPLVDF